MQPIINIVINVAILIIFLAGLYYYAYMGMGYNFGTENIEGMTSRNRCPNMLIQDGIKFYLYNSKLYKVPGVNPIEFSNLEEYVEFTNWQRSQGIRCPVLYLQKSYNAQGDANYKIRPHVNDLQGGLPPTIITPSTNVVSPIKIKSQMNPVHEKSSDNGGFMGSGPHTLLVDATHDDLPYNTNSMPSYDSSAYYIGKITPLDIMDLESEALLHSPNPMDDNWGGTKYTQSLVEKGYYKDNTRTMD
jgi:hypothetical protein